MLRPDTIDSLDQVCNNKHSKAAAARDSRQATSSILKKLSKFNLVGLIRTLSPREPLVSVDSQLERSSASEPASGSIKHVHKEQRPAAKPSAIPARAAVTVDRADVASHQATLRQPRLGDVVVVGTSDPVQGKVRYVGPVQGRGVELWVGLELMRPLGMFDGSIDGVRYFQCAPMHGTFIRLALLCSD